MTRVSAEELADLVPCALEDVRRLEDLGLLDPDPHELFPVRAVDAEGRHERRAVSS